MSIKYRINTRITRRSNLDNTKVNRVNRQSLTVAAMGTVAMLSTGSLHAANQTWSPTANSTAWATTSDWVSGVAPGTVVTPGTVKTIDNSIVTFNSAIYNNVGGSLNPLINENVRVVGGFTFDTANAGAYVIGVNGGNTLELSQNNTTQITGTVVNPETIAAPVVLAVPSSTNAVYTFNSNSSTPSATLSLTGGLTSSNANTRPTTFTLTGNNTGNNLINTINTSGGALVITKTGSGLWMISGASNATSLTSASVAAVINVSAGTLALENSAAVGTVPITVATGTLRLDGSLTISNALTLGYGGVLQANGGTSTFNTVSVATTASAGDTFSTVNSTDVLNIGTSTANSFSGGATTTTMYVTGPGTVNLQGASNYLGSWALYGGTVSLGAATSMGASPVVTFGANSTSVLQLNGQSPTFSSLTTSSPVGTPIVKNGASSNSTLTLNLAAANTFAGVLQDGTAGGTLGLTKGGVGTLTLSGLNTYSGATQINTGKLILTPTSSLGYTSITVAAGAVFAPQPVSGSISAGSVTAGSAGATLTLLPGTGSAAGAGFDMTDGDTGIFNLNQQTGFSGTALTLGGSGTAANAPYLTFEMGSSKSDELVVPTGTVSVGSTGADVNITLLPGTSSVQSSYTLISAPGGGLTPLTLTNNSILIGTQAYTLSLANSTSTAEILTLTANNTTPLYAYFTGANGTSWSATGPTNFATDHTGATATSGTPGGVTNVFMTADGANSANLSTTLDSVYNINSLTFTGTGTTAATTSVTIAAGSGGSLELTPTTAFNTASGTKYGPGTGLLVQAGSAAHSISAPIMLGASQTWEIDNAPANGLTVSGVISDANLGYVLNKTGTGTLILSGINTYTGGTNISAGILQTTASGALPVNYPLTVNGGTLDLAGTTQTVSTLSDGGLSTGLIINTGAATTFNINGSTGSSFSGSFNASASTLSLNGTGPVVLSGANQLQYVNVNAGLTTLAAPGSITGGTTSDLSVGDNGNFNVTGGTISVAAFYTNSKGTSATIIGSGSTINVTGALAVDNDNGAANASYLQNSGGVLNVGSITIGRTGTSTGSGTIVTAGLTNQGLYMTSGTINDAGTFYLGTNALTNSNADMRMDGGTFNVSGATIITCIGNNRLSTVDVNGGIFNATTVQLGGSIGTAVGQSGELLVRGGVANVNAITFGNSAQVTGPNVLELLGGSLYVGAGGLVNNSPVTPTLNFGGTTYATAPIIAASAPWSTSLLITLTNSSTGVAPVFQAANASGGAVNITLNGNLEGNGGLTKTGAGTLFITNANGYFGITNISAGILNINGQFALGGADYGGASFSGGTLQFAAASFPTNANGTGDISQNSTGTAKPVTINAGGAIIDTNGNPVTFADSVGNNGTGSLTLSDSATVHGSLTLTGSNTYKGGTFVTAGTLNFGAPHALPNFTALNLSAGTFVNVTANTGIKNTLFASSLTIGSTNTSSGLLDLANNDMVVQNGNLATISNLVKQGFAGGTWQGSGGIVSTTAAADTTRLTALGVIQNSVNGLPNGSATLYSSFDGATAAATTDVLVKYTYYGDANLDGKVDGSDYSLIDNGYLNHLTGWYNGDFNYDGVVDGSDYTLIDNAFNSQGTQISAEIASPTAQIAGGSASSAVPEPTTLGLLGIGAVGLLGRRSRRHR